MNLRVLKELDDVTGRPLFIFERPSKFGEVPNGLEKARCCTCLQKKARTIPATTDWQLHFRKVTKASSLGSHFWAHRGEKCDWKGTVITKGNH